MMTYFGGKDKLVKDHPLFKPTTFYNLSDGNEEMVEAQDKWFQQIFENVVALVKNRGGKGDQELAEKMQTFFLGWKNKAVEAATPLHGDFVTIIHGDMWYKNLMLRQDFFSFCLPVMTINLVHLSRWNFVQIAKEKSMEQLFSDQNAKFWKSELKNLLFRLIYQVFLY